MMFMICENKIYKEYSIDIIDMQILLGRANIQKVTIKKCFYIFVSEIMFCEIETRL